jgi:zinc transporter, ZIP family
MKGWLWVAVPLVLLALLVAVFLTVGTPGVLKASLPPIERLAIQRVEFASGEVTVRVVNDGPDPVAIAQVLVNDAYWSHSLAPERPIRRLERAVVTIPYPWVEGEPLSVTLVTSSGLTFGTTVEVAALTPRLGARYLASLGLLGLYIGVIPVFLGVLWLPFLRRLRETWFQVLMAMTLGLLAFLGVDSLVEAAGAAADVPSSLGGVGLIILGWSAAFLLLTAFSTRRGRVAPVGEPAADRDEPRARTAVAYAIAFGIGVHNLGEGLAVGGAYATGNVALGSLLVVGFMVHNITEGVAIVAPISRVKSSLATLVWLGLLAGAPAIAGAWIGGLSFSPVSAVLFLAVGSGAIFQVFVQILSQMGKGSPARLVTLPSAAGFVAGVAVMYATSLLVTA